ncbi:substrate-binding domain-containing protein [uncultured Alsobacter sp.]|uniref:LacI family DNA-binding transcriptional regulator n=1 Tax=uncultured Alsobacter sp. TaxID=1748258 RepID=UPI0025D52C43|nr:substrate-binding domain-containing protein [uncultured Alsobacter sp.]
MTKPHRTGLPKPQRGFITAADVARAAGVSRSAVSRTFTPGASVSQEVRERVQDAARAMGYRVNRLASNLISDESTLVGVVGSNLSSPFMSRQLDELSRALQRSGRQCLLFNAADARDGVEPLIESILEFRVAAIVIMSGAPPSAIIDECLKNGVRVILVNRQPDEAAGDTVVSDDIHGVGLVADRLLRAGCRKLAVVGSGVPTPSQVRRRQLFASAMAKAGREVVTWSQGTSTYDSGLEAARSLMPGSGIDGVFCTTDLIALGFLDGARACGLAVPEQVSVMGYDDIAQSAWLAYRLTTIRQSPVDLASAVVAALARSPDDGPSRAQSLLPVELVERDTVRSGA